jgi:hypothetical protein
VIEIRHDRLDLDLAIDEPELSRRSLGLGKIVLDILFVEEDLALQVVGLDEIPIDDPQVPDAGANEMVRQNGPQRSASTERDPAFHEGSLTRFTQCGEANLTRVTIKGVGGRNRHQCSPEGLHGTD